MALTLTRVADQQDYWGSHFVDVFTAQPGTSDYSAGGYNITAASVGMRLILAVEVIGQQLAAGGNLTTMYLWALNPNTGNLQFFTAYNTENSGNLVTYTFTLRVIGQR